MNDYRTLANKRSIMFVEKRSKFIGTAMPVSTEPAALQFIDEIKSEFWDATHNVYAYILRDGQVSRYSDAGEPKGTAGRPVLDVLQKENLTDCAVVVTRYFGGVLLGAGGLVRAYSHCAKIAVDAAGIVTMRRCKLCSILCDYSRYDPLLSLLNTFSAVIDDTGFAEKVTVKFLLPADILPAFKIQVTDIFSGSLTVTPLSEKYAAF